MKMLTFDKALGLEFLGRNGNFRMCGLVITPLTRTRTIYLQPITSRGLVGRCALEIPASAVRAFCDALQAMALELAPAQASGQSALDGVDELIARFGPHGEHPDHPRSDWKYEVANGDTQRGYWDYVAAKLEEETNSSL